MKSIKSFLFLLITFVYIFCLSSSVCAVEDEINFDKWNRIEESYLITTDDTPSNSSLRNAVLKVTEDKASHRLTILFMLEFNSFTDINNVGIIMTVNDGEEIVIHTDRDAEYNEDKYHLVSTVVFPQEQTQMIFMQTVLGIKDGLPDEKILTLQIKDTEGVLSNRYTVNISGNEAEDTTVVNAEQTTDSTSKKKPTDKTKKPSKTNKADKATVTTTESTLTSLLEDSVTVDYTENDNNEVTLGTGKVVGVITGIIVLILSAGYGLSHLIKAKQQKRGEG